MVISQWRADQLFAEAEGNDDGDAEDDASQKMNLTVRNRQNLFSTPMDLKTLRLNVQCQCSVPNKKSKRRSSRSSKYAELIYFTFCRGRQRN